ncbi:MAG: zinc metallopeptidase [Clostridia bacterium]|nr:zinc metallopeptidase [Clostridia bacterium]
MFFDIYYLIIVLPFVLLALYASYMVKSTYAKYERMDISNGISGAEAARMVLDSHGLTHVRIETVEGNLTDHYDPRTDTVYLSGAVYSGRNAAACGVAAHEAGHAVQHAEEYAPARLRMALVPVTNVGSSVGMWLILLGVVLIFLADFFVYVAYAGVLLFSLTALFQLVTLPVEFNASRRAMAALSSSGMFNPAEERGARRVLTAAAMTYVAALAVSLAQILRLLLIIGNAAGRRRD